MQYSAPSDQMRSNRSRNGRSSIEASIVETSAAGNSAAARAANAARNGRWVSTAWIRAPGTSRASTSVCRPGPHPRSRTTGLFGNAPTAASARRVDASEPGPSCGRPEWISKKMFSVMLRLEPGYGTISSSPTVAVGSMRTNVRT
jgi:hypothetical protein